MIIKIEFVRKLFFIILFFVGGCIFKEQKSPQVAFNIPHLFGKDIDAVRAILGKPEEVHPDPPSGYKAEYENSYHSSDQTLLISFDPDSRKVRDFLIVSSKEYNDIHDLLKLGNLYFMESAEYRIEISNHSSNDFKSFIVRPK